MYFLCTNANSQDRTLQLNPLVPVGHHKDQTQYPFSEVNPNHEQYRELCFYDMVS